MPSQVPVGSPQAEKLPAAVTTNDSQSHRHRLSWHGSIFALFGIFIINLLLTLLTLGIYRFWGKVNVRRYVLSQTEFEKDRFAYHGRGIELLIGFLKVLLVFGIPYILLGLLQGLSGQGSTLQLIGILLSIGLGLIFIPIATVGARRYRLSRTSWRGIRFSFRGTPSAYLKLFLKGVLLSVLTLGIYYPWFMIERQRFLLSHSYCGNQSFSFHGQGKDLFWIYTVFFVVLLLSGPLALLLAQLPSFVLAFLLLLPILGLFWRDLLSSLVFALMLIALSLLLFYLLSPLNSEVLAFLMIFPVIASCWLWFSVKKQCYVWDQTSFMATRFHSTITADRLLFLKLQNALPLLVSFGLAWPWASIRTLQFTFSHVTLEGQLDLSTIQQEADLAPITGAGFLSFLDMEFDLG